MTAQRRLWSGPAALHYAHLNRFAPYQPVDIFVNKLPSYGADIFATPHSQSTRHRNNRHLFHEINDFAGFSRERVDKYVQVLDSPCMRPTCA
jgi:hypothetical protein